MRFRRGRSVKVGQPNRSGLPATHVPASPLRPQVNVHASLNETSARRPGAAHAALNSALFVLVDDHFTAMSQPCDTHNASRMRMLATSDDAFSTHDLAHHQLQGQASRSRACLLRHLAHQATNRQRISRLLPWLSVSSNPWIRHRQEWWRSNARSICSHPGPAKQRCKFRPATRAEQIFEGHLAQLGDFSSEATLPCRIGIQKLARRAQRGNHLIRILEQIP